METSWDSVSMSGGAAAFSLNGSKFGCKIYFDETATASPIGPPPPPISASSGSGKKGRTNPGSHPPCCQVEGCELDLSNAKLYYSKHKVCPTHSKSPKVIVGGVHRRFCQQCSRFHPLPEFDQGKRSCRRRLAGHNKRRRKPPSGSFFPSCYGSDGGCGGIMLDFTAYSRTSLKDSWQISRPKECEPATRSNAPHQRLNNSGNPHPSHVLLQSSAARAGFSSYANPPGDSNFRRAFSLLSSQPLGYGNKDAGTGSNGLISSAGQPMAQQKMPHAAVTVKGHESCSSSSAMPSNLSINQFSDRAVPLQPHMEVDYFKACDGTTQHIYQFSDGLLGRGQHPAYGEAQDGLGEARVGVMVEHDACWMSLVKK